MNTAVISIPSQSHQYPDHPESPDRFSLLEDLKNKSYQDKLTWLTGSTADKDRIASVHTYKMIDEIENICKHGSAVIDYAPTYVTTSSYLDALNAAGGVLACTRSVVAGDNRNAFAIVRPPGHHAEPGHAMGFCIFNNIAIAAQQALQEGLDRILIFDFDAHHGNGTQAAFLQEERVVYFSTHQENIYPGTGHILEAPEARGRIINLPLPAYTGDKNFNLIADRVLAPLVEKFNPELILVSAGFDSHWEDPLTNLGLSTSGFYRIAIRLIELAEQVCGGRTVFVLEGGYLPEKVLAGVDASLCALTGTHFNGPSDPSPYPEPDLNNRITQLLKIHNLD